MKKKNKNKNNKISNVVLFLAVIVFALIVGCFNIDNINKEDDDPMGELSEFLSTLAQGDETTADETIEEVADIMESTAENSDETTVEPTTETVDETITTPAENLSSGDEQTTIPSKTVSESGRIVIDPQQESWNLVVVNASREMPSDYVPVLDEIFSTGVYMDERVVPHYEEMYTAAKADGIILTPYSGYRSYERQERNYNNLTETYMSRYNISREEAALKAATVILPPGTSEHNLGLAMDICNTLDSFAETEEYEWLTENAHKFGFILRYTDEKMDVTGIVDEPWHWRFVGTEFAEEIKNSGLCLEEYLEMKGIDY